MSNDRKNHLFILIKSLTRSEKRQFRLYVGRLGGNENAKYMILFDLLDKMKAYEETSIIEKGFVTKQQLPNLKAHLYKQILISLRLNPSYKDIRIQIREQLDFASILYQKGLYNQSLKILDKAKSLALDHDEKNLAFVVVELEKIIESQYITRSMNNRADALAQQAKELSQENVIASKLSNLSLLLYGYYLRFGHVKNQEQLDFIRQFFEDHVPACEESELRFRERLWYYKSHLWYSFLIQDFLSCYKYAKKWVDLFYTYPEMKRVNPVFFIKGSQYLMEALYFVRKYDRYVAAIESFETSVNSVGFPKHENTSTLTFLTLQSHKMNLYFWTGEFAEGVHMVDAIEKGIETHRDRIDEYHVFLFYYKIACLYFGSGQNKKCMEYLDRIITNKELVMREDLLCYSRILNLIAHFEIGEEDKVLKETYNFLIKMDNLNVVQQEIIVFLENLIGAYPSAFKGHFQTLYDKMLVLSKDPYERRAFLYLDILSWLESKINNRKVADVIKEKFDKERSIA